jgi:hypothetical protein
MHPYWWTNVWTTKKFCGYANYVWYIKYGDNDLKRKIVCFLFQREQRDEEGLYNVDCVWNAMAQAHKPDFVFRRKEQVHLNRRGLQFSRLLAAEVCASAIVMLDTPCSEVVWWVLATHSILQFSLHFPSLRPRVPSHFNWTLRQTQHGLEYRTHRPIRFYGSMCSSSSQIHTWPRN